MIALLVGFIALIGGLVAIGGAFIGGLYAYGWLEQRHRTLAPIFFTVLLLAVPAYLFGSFIIERLSK